MPGLYFDQRWCAQHGIGRFATETRKHLVGWNDLPINGYPTNATDAWRLGRCLRREKATLFFSPGFNVPAFAKCRVVCTIHDLIHVHYRDKQSKLKLAYYKHLQRPVVRRSPLTLTVSEFSRQQIIQWYGLRDSQVVCVGNGVSDEFTPDGPRLDTDQRFLLYVGNTRPHKNVDVLLRALSRIDSDLSLTMVMKPNDSIRRRIQQLGLAQRVRFRTGLSDAELAMHYRAAVATVLPSYFEGFGLPLVEAMACGCPVMGADRTSIPEVMGSAGLLFDPDDEESLVEQITRIESPSSDRQSKVALGLRQASRFRWADVAYRIDNALKNVA
ncbi:D-inositol 3-phosphate glycosyltransferase [Rubripirellula lacrimiformis]|uniref:D-inositol 3-phosphate glycosyltransferase n=1 Tax=Rubripirellula lacrimiformis TaxID=1930273 RepID=A0A517NG16_9BACT|nr:glycosyltransferase family 1 protein [Rubripirellula lacrimiformis]QDT06018.1 D-inositol 3-phosphate glycosyltransferase [Rubripirellula lacrimiformis]